MVAVRKHALGKRYDGQTTSATSARFNPSTGNTPLATRGIPPHKRTQEGSFNPSTGNTPLATAVCCTPLNHPHSPSIASGRGRLSGSRGVRRRTVKSATFAPSGAVRRNRQRPKTRSDALNRDHTRSARALQARLAFAGWVAGAQPRETTRRRSGVAAWRRRALAPNKDTRASYRLRSQRRQARNLEATAKKPDDDKQGTRSLQARNPAATGAGLRARSPWV